MPNPFCTEYLNQHRSLIPLVCLLVASIIALILLPTLPVADYTIPAFETAIFTLGASGILITAYLCRDICREFRRTNIYVHPTEDNIGDGSPLPLIGPAPAL